MSNYELLNTPVIDVDNVPPTSTPDVPPDYLIQSGGGISNMHHGAPQGPYSTTAERSDLYGMSIPLPQTGFAEAVRGDFYEGGFTGQMAPRTCEECAMNQAPSYAHFPEANLDYPYSFGPQVIYPTKKNLSQDLPSDSDNNIVEGKDYTLIEPFDANITVRPKAGQKLKDNPWLSLLYLFLIFLVINLWIKFANHVLDKYIFKTEHVTWKQLLIIASIATAILIFYSLWIGSDRKALEKDIESRIPLMGGGNID